MTSATIFPDTTILIQYDSLDQIDWEAVFGVKNVKLMLTASVLQEMNDIKNQDISPALSKRARQSLMSIQTLLEASKKDPSRIQLFKVSDPKIDFAAEGLDPNSVADMLVASIITYQQANALEYVILLSDDKRTKNKAGEAGIELGNLPPQYLFTRNAPAPSTSPAFEITTSVEPPETNGLFADGAMGLTKSGPLFQSAANQETTENNVPEEAETVDTGLDFEPIPAVTADNGYSEQSEASEETVTDEESASVETPKPEAPPPFVEIKQAPARPDYGHYEIFNTPQNAPPLTPSEPPTPAVKSTESPTPEVKSPEPEEKPLLDLTPSFSFTSNPQSTSDRDEDSFIPVEPAAASEQLEPEQTELRLAFSESEARTSVIIRHPMYPSIDEVAARLAQVRNSVPKLKVPVSDLGGDGLGNSLTDPLAITTEDVIVQRKSQRIKRYNSTLDTYYANTEKYLGDIAEFENLRRRSAQLDLCLINDLADSLKSLYIVIHFPSQIRVFSEENLPERPTGPKPPEQPDLSRALRRHQASFGYGPQ